MIKERKGKVSLNIATNILAFGINILISFWLTPYVTENLGNEAYGFITLANAVISYLSIVSTALNAYASRFICLSYFKSDYQESSRYYSSVLFANILIIIIILIFLGPFISNLTFFFHISEELLFDVERLFVSIFINYFITLLAVAFSVGIIINNRLDIDAIKNIIIYFLKALLIYGGFKVIGNHVWIVGVATLLCSICALTINMIYQLHVIDKLKFRITYISLWHTKEVIKSGIWTSIGSIGNILNSGLDIWVTNRFLDGTAMGYIAISNSLTTMMSGLASTLIMVYWPKELEAYSFGEEENLKKIFKKAIRIQGVFASMILSGFICIGKDFLRLWVPFQNTDKLYIIILIGVMSYAMTAITRPLSSIFSLVNRLKVNAILNICVGFVNFIGMLILLSTTDLGVYAVALTSAIPSIIYGMVFIPVYSSRCLDCKCGEWYKEVIRFYLICVLLTITFKIISMLFVANSWVLLVLKILICTLVGALINFFVYLSKIDRKSLMEISSKYNKG